MKIKIRKTKKQQAAPNLVAKGQGVSASSVVERKENKRTRRIPIVNKIPLLNIPDEAIVSSTQDMLPVLDIEKDLVLFKDGGVALILESTSLNFGLLSEEEQYAVISAYAAFINSLSFTVQILIRTQKKDISKYLEYLTEAAPKVQNAKLHEIMQGYINFISETIRKKNVLEKKFYIVIPFSPYELGISKSTFTEVFKKGEQLPYPKEYIFKKAEIALYPKRDHLIRQMSRLGLKLKQLTNEEIIELYWDTIKPDVEILKESEKEVAENAKNTKQ